MRFYIKQKFLSFNEKFYIYDRDEKPHYYVEGKLFSFPKRFTFQDMNGKVLYKIEQEVWSLLPRFKVYKGDELLAVVSRKMTFFSPKYEISHLDWTVQGNITGHEYEVHSGNFKIADVSKTYFSLGDSYEINIHDEEYAEQILVLVIVIDENMSMDGQSS